MPPLTEFFFKLVPLYLIIGLGFVAGKWLNVKRESIAPLLLYIIVPIVTFKSIFLQTLSIEMLTYPLFMLGTSLGLSLLFFYIGKKLFSAEDAGLLSLCAGLANVGYFGLPLVLILFDEKALGIVMLLILGTAIHESSFAFLIAARGKYKTRDAIIKTLKLPAIYTSVLAVICNHFYHNYYQGIALHPSLRSLFDQLLISLLDSVDKFVGAYTVLGMLMIGLGLSTISHWKFDFKFTALAFIAKFLCYPLLALSLVLINNNYLHFYSEEVTRLLFLMSLVPTGANTISIATELRMDTDKVSITVLLSTIFALIYIPVVLFFCSDLLGLGPTAINPSPVIFD